MIVSEVLIIINDKKYYTFCVLKRNFIGISLYHCRNQEEQSQQHRSTSMTSSRSIPKDDDTTAGKDSEDTSSIVTDVPVPNTRPDYSLYFTIIGIFRTIVIYVGIFGNSFAFFVFFTKEMSRLPGNILLQALVLADVLTLVGVEVFYVRGVLIGCKASTYITAVVDFSSKFVLVLLNVDRFLAVFFPLKWKTFIHFSTRVKALLVMLAAACLIYSYRLYPDKVTGSNYRACRLFYQKKYPEVETNVHLAVNIVVSVSIALFSMSISVKLCCASTETEKMVTEEAQKRNKEKVNISYSRRCHLKYVLGQVLVQKDISGSRFTFWV